MPEQPKIGDLVRDAAARRVGEFMAVQSGVWLLRPAGGGSEWEADPGHVEPLTPEEALSAKVSVANRRSISLGDMA